MYFLFIVYDFFNFLQLSYGSIIRSHTLEIKKKLEETESWMPKGEKVKIILTSGASCPDSVVDRVMQSILSQFGNRVAEVDATIKDALAKLPG